MAIDMMSTLKIGAKFLVNLCTIVVPVIQLN